jgi:hypothetical protein
MTTPTKSVANPIPQSWTWGSSVRVLSVDNTISPSLQLGAVTLPEPAVCSLYFQVTITRASTDPLAAVRAYTLNLLQGVGRVTIPRQITFDAQPAVGAPIEFTLAFMPLHALQVNVQQLCQNIVASPMETECYLVLSPLHRVAAAPAEQGMTFGMDLPGEADELDHELVQELEEDCPTVAAVMAAGDDDSVAEPEIIERPSEARVIVDQIIARLTERLGRPPTRPEAEAAVRRMQARLDRRGARGGDR